MIYVCLPNIDLYTFVFSLALSSIPCCWDMALPSFPLSENYRIPPFRKGVSIFSGQERLFLLILLVILLFFKTMSLFGADCHLNSNVNQVSVSCLFCMYCCNGKKTLHPFPLILWLSPSFYQGDFFSLKWAIWGSSNRQRFC